MRISESSRRQAAEKRREAVAQRRRVADERSEPSSQMSSAAAQSVAEHFRSEWQAPGMKRGPHTAVVRGAVLTLPPTAEERDALVGDDHGNRDPLAFARLSQSPEAAFGIWNRN